MFGLGLELETNQTIQPYAPLCPPNMARNDKKCIKDRSKWLCKVCIVTYYVKWLLTKHLREVHDLMIEKTKLGKPSILKKSFQH
jgi:hypothetical protein